MKDDAAALLQSVDGSSKAPKKKLRLKMIRPLKEEGQTRMIRSQQREEQIRKQAEEDTRKLLKKEFEELKQKLEEQVNTIQDLQFDIKFSEGQNKKNKKEIKSMNYQLEICHAQIISMMRVFIQIIKYFLTKCVR